MQLACERRAEYMCNRSRRASQQTQPNIGLRSASGSSSVLQESRKRRHCQVARCHGNKTAHECAKCKKAVCNSCRAATEIVCILCEENT